MSNKKDITDYSSEELLAYLDEHGRKLIDPTSSDRQDYDWFPANDPAQKLWRCVEALRDIAAVLSGTKGLSNAAQSRKLKVLATPAYSFLCAVRDLGNDLIGNPNTTGRLQEAERRHVSELNRAIEYWFPLGKGSTLRDARDKTSAHIDKKLHPRRVQAILAKTPPREIGRWLHQAILVLLEFTKFDVYAWSADAPEDCVRLMTCEPVGVLIKDDPEHGKNIMEIELSRSPRIDVQDACRQVVLVSEWMFEPGQGRIIWSDKAKPRLDTE